MTYVNECILKQTNCQKGTEVEKANEGTKLEKTLQIERKLGFYEFSKSKVSKKSIQKIREKIRCILSRKQIQFKNKFLKQLWK